MSSPSPERRRRSPAENEIPADSPDASSAPRKPRTRRPQAVAEAPDEEFSLIDFAKKWYSDNFQQADGKARAKALVVSTAVHIFGVLLLAFVVVSNVRQKDGGGQYWLVEGWGDGPGGGGDGGQGGVEDSMQPVVVTATASAPVAIGTEVSTSATTVGAVPSEGATASNSGTGGSGPGGTPGPIGPPGGANRLGNRGGARRSGSLEESAGSNASAVRRCIDAGAGWLVRQQSKGGNWQLHTGYPDAGESVIRTDAGATALALLVLLGDGNTHLAGPHKEPVRKGLTWLRSIQKSDGDYHDHVELGRQTAFYAHSQATLAMCEAYALTGDPALKDSATKAVGFLLASQHPSKGGWRYQPQDDKSMGDLSVTGWCLMALHTARMAKIDIPSETFGGASAFLDSVEVSNGSRYKYLPNDPNNKMSPAMTAEGLLCRQWLGWPKNWPAMNDGVKFLLAPEQAPQWAAGRRNVYEWYYVAQTLHNIGGDDWKNWYGPVARLIIDHQKKAGSNKAPTDIMGSWGPKDPRGANEEYSEKAGRLYLTALCLLVLETPYRHTPVYEE